MNAVLALLLLVQENTGEVPKKLVDGFRSVEGLAVDLAGHLYVSDHAANRILKWDGAKLAVWRDKAGGPRGLRFDKDANLYVCEARGKRVVKIAPDGTVTVLAEKFRGYKFNSPTDVAVDGRGGIYFSDPNYGGDGNRTLFTEAVYYLPPGGGRLARVVENLKRPHGVEVIDNILLVSDAIERRIYRFAIEPDGTLKPAQEILVQEVDASVIRLDAKLNGYILTPKGVRLTGRMFQTELGFARPPEPATACHVEGKVLYVGTAKAVYTRKTIVD